MWIRREEYLRLVSERDGAVRRSEEAATLLGVMRSNEDWLRIQLNTAHLERAELLARLTNVKVPVPSIERISDNTKHPSNADFSGPANGALPSLEDVGDEIAQMLGVRHGDDGTLVYDR